MFSQGQSILFHRKGCDESRKLGPRHSSCVLHHSRAWSLFPFISQNLPLSIESRGNQKTRFKIIFGSGHRFLHTYEHDVSQKGIFIMRSSPSLLSEIPLGEKADTSHRNNTNNSRILFLFSINKNVNHKNN
jgi:hypothetical protein